MSWFYLILAGMLEIGWPLGLKLAQQEGYRWHGFAAALACIAGSGYFLYLAQIKYSDGYSLRRLDRHRRGRGVFGRCCIFQRCRQLRPLARRLSHHLRRRSDETLQRKLKISFLFNPRPSEQACSDGLIPSRI